MKQTAYLCLALLLMSVVFAEQTKAQSNAELMGMVQQLIDENEIRQVKHRYGSTMDAKDFEGFAKVFADTVEVDMTARGGELMSLSNAQVVGLYKKVLTGLSTQHFLSDLQVKVDGDSATLNANYYSIHLKDGKRYDSTGFSTEHYIKTEDGWRISYLKLAPYISPQYD